MNLKSEAVVLSRKSFQDADRLVTFYTKDLGKITCIAKGVKRPTSRKSGHLEPATHCTIFVAKGKNLDILTEVETQRAYGLEHLSQRTANEAYHLLELVDHLTVQNQKNKEVFELLLAFLRSIGANKNKNALIAAFKIKLLSSLGFFSSVNLKNSQSKKLLQSFETFDIEEIETTLGNGQGYLKLLTFLDSIIEKITERKLKTSRFVNAQI